ncbi:MAG: RNA methyltransferase [Rudaea sp.]|uniref:RNA methyltransferase n=1 Tax=unclassified Rudaea TaxID=2627037 RepID=UPI0010F66EA4|nr:MULTISPECIES: RNA methyltransferase [unclassified Rudaea]MBN8886657.1 RNA methyltransferase [Rudaea sp.]
MSVPVSNPQPASPGAQNIRFVLVRTSHPGNIGAAARAIRTMGFTRLVLVAPHKYPHADATAMAAGADDVLENIVVVPTLDEAIADCNFVLGCTARRRGVSLPEIAPRDAAARVGEAAGEVAVVFGNERTGLENEELMRCHAAVHIPADPSYSSLNLAQAVQVLAYELRLAQLEARPIDKAAPKSDPPATAEQMEYFFGHLFQTLNDIDFHKGRSPVTIEQRLRKLFQHASLDQREVRILRGIFDDAQRMARMVKSRD